MSPGPSPLPRTSPTSNCQQCLFACKLTLEQPSHPSMLTNVTYSRKPTLIARASSTLTPGSGFLQLCVNSVFGHLAQTTWY